MKFKVKGRTLKLIQWIGIGLMLFHMYAATTQYLPAKIGLVRRLNVWLKPYLEATTSVQNFRLFHSIPALASYEVTIFATDTNNETREFGPLLPGLKPYVQALRVYNGFWRMDRKDHFHARSRDTYRLRLCNAIQQQGFEAEVVEVKINKEKIRKIELIRRGQPIGVNANRSWGRFSCHSS